MIIRVSQAFPINVKAENDAGSLYIRAYITELDGDAVTTVNLTHQTGGWYLGTYTYSGAEKQLNCRTAGFTDAGYSIADTTRVYPVEDIYIDDSSLVGSAMTLANDSITAAVFDESTAYPVKSADTGSTAIFRTGADSDTGETLSDQIDIVTTVLSGITSLAKWLRGLFRKDTMDATAKSEVNNGGGAFNETTDSLEAVRDRGDAAWITATGFSTPTDISNLQTHGDTDWATATGFAVPGDEMDLIDAFDAAKTAASQTSVNDIPNNTEFNARTLPSAEYGTLAKQTTIEGKIDILDTNLDKLLAEYDFYHDVDNGKFYVYAKGTSTVIEEYDVTLSASNRLTRLDKV